MAERPSKPPLTRSRKTVAWECDLCRYDDIVAEGIGFCTSCQEYLCEGCLRVHKRSHASRDHSILQGDGFLTAPKESVSPLESELCSLHKDRVVEFFCVHHDAVGCSACRGTDHRRCQDIRPIDESCDGAATGEEVTDFLVSSKSLVKQLKDLQGERNRDLNKLLAETEVCLDSIHRFRSRANELLDGLEEAASKTLTHTVEKETGVIREHISSLETAITSLETGITKLETAEPYGDDKKVFIAMKTTAADKMKGVLKDIGDERYTLQLEFVGNNVLLDVVENLQMLGELRMRKQKMGPTTEKAFHGNICLPADVKDMAVEHIGEANVREPGDQHMCKIRGMLFLPNGILLLSDFDNKKLKLTDFDLKVHASVRLEGSPRDVNLTAASEAVVMIAWKRQLQFVALEPDRLRLGRTVALPVDLKKVCCGVAVSGERILISCHENPGNGEVLIMDSHGAVQKRLGTSNDGACMFRRPNFIAASSSGDRLFVADSDDHCPKVVCLTMDGNTVYTYSGKELKKPRSMLVDESDSVYVCDRSRHIVQVVSKEGREHRTVLRKSDGLKRPMVLSYRSSDKTLVVGSWKNDVVQIYRFI